MLRPFRFPRPLWGLPPGGPVLLLVIGLCVGSWACGPSEGNRERASGPGSSEDSEGTSSAWRVDWPSRGDAVGYVVEGWAGRRLVFRRSVPDTFAVLQPAEIRAIRALGGVDSVEIQVRPREGEASPGLPNLREPWRGHARVTP